MNKIKINLRTEIINFGFLLVGCFFCALAINVFFNPLRITMGGFSGLAAIAYNLTGEGEFLSFGMFSLIFNIPVLILGWKEINFKFVYRSIIGTIVYSIEIDFFTPIMKDWFQRIDMPIGDRPVDPFIYCIIAGFLMGIGLGLVFRGHYTTGGTDILAIIIHRRMHYISIGSFLVLLDLVIISVTIFFYWDSNKASIILAMYSIVGLYITGKAVDVILEGLNYSRVAYIISHAANEISKQIMQKMERGVTALQGEGMYTETEKKVLLCVLSNKEVLALKKIVAEVDQQAFVIVFDAREVYGEGFGNAIELGAHDF